VSPLLANIALYAMEEALLKADIGERKAPCAGRGVPHPFTSRFFRKGEG
jgi:RNA-directed DNA polymerase